MSISSVSRAAPDRFGSVSTAGRGSYALAAACRLYAAGKARRCGDIHDGPGRELVGLAMLLQGEATMPDPDPCTIGAGRAS